MKRTTNKSSRILEKEGEEQKKMKQVKIGTKME